MTTLTTSTTTQPAEGPTPRIETPEAAEALCTRLVQTIADLVDVLDRETDLLKRNKTEAITAVHARKTALSAALMHDMEALKQDAAYIRMAVPGHVDAIEQQQQAFQRSLAANQDALAAMKAVSESLLRTVADRVGAKRAGPEVYRADAGLAGTSPGRPSAISVDTTL